MRSCKQCSDAVHNRVAIYCSNKCQVDFQYAKYIEAWREGKANGERGIITKGLSKHSRRYLIEKYGNSCTICGWNEANPSTGKVPVEVDHIDGNSENNLESNLRLICPNCHSLTSNFRNLNQGNGRQWRRIKYLRST